MNNFNSSNKYAEQAIKSLFALIIINIFCFIIFKSLNTQEDIAKYNMWFSLNSYGVHKWWIWQYITSMFMHADFSHILFNMWGLYIFGKLVAPILGMKRFLSLYFISGIIGGIIYVLSVVNDPLFAVIGASGAVMGVTIACGMLLPNSQFMLLFFPTPIKAKTLVVVYVLLNIFGVGGSNIAFTAHLGGVLGGYIYLKIIFRKNPHVLWDPFSGLFGLLKIKNKQYRAKDINNNIKQKKTKNIKDKYSRFSHNNTNISVNAKDGYSRGDNQSFTQKEIDYLLNKISEQGVKSLTEEEFQKLKAVRKQVQKNR